MKKGLKNKNHPAIRDASVRHRRIPMLTLSSTMSAPRSVGARAR